MHARSIGIKYPRHLDAQSMLAPIIKEQGLGATLAFVIARAWTNRVDVPPIIFNFGAGARIAAHLRRTCQHGSCPQSFSTTQPVHPAVGARPCRAHRVWLV